MRVYLSIVILGALLVSCVTPPQRPVEATSARKTDHLSARTMAPGECGLFVWTANAQKRFILFSQSNKKQAVWYKDAGEHSIEVLSLNGQVSNGQNPRQVFKTQDEQTLDLDLKHPEVITNGTRFKAGTLTISSENAWDKVMPVVGLAACQPA